MVSYRVGDSSLLFVETEAFTACIQNLLDDDVYRPFQRDMVQNPKKGVLMPGCGGLRKVRVEEPRRGKGKRSGCRIIYLYMPEAARVDLLAIYNKDMQEDLTQEQRRALKTLANRARLEAMKHSASRKDA